ncbi:MAG: hypothetical protein IPG04_05040 [Polyangiaceae bacterium]|nr:hypothetical protein [Polyangiaceae bacterium]
MPLRLQGSLPGATQAFEFIWKTAQRFIVAIRCPGEWRMKNEVLDLFKMSVNATGSPSARNLTSCP